MNDSEIIRTTTREHTPNLYTSARLQPPPPLLPPFPSRYWTGADSGSPVFLCVGGEGPPLKPNVLYESVHCNDMMELAPEHNVRAASLE